MSCSDAKAKLAGKGISNDCAGDSFTCGRSVWFVYMESLSELERTLLNHQVYEMNVLIYTGSDSAVLIHPETLLCFSRV